MTAQRSVSLLVSFLVIAAVPAHALVPGGGLANTDCRVVYEGVDATSGASGVVCLDGDPGCDGDGAADGTCRFSVKICTGVPTPSCTPTAVDGIATGGAQLATPAGAHGCGADTVVEVPVGQAVGSTLIATGDGGVRDVDYLNLCCRATAGAFDAAICALAVDPTVSGCARKTVPLAARHAFLRARTLVAQAAANPTHARPRRRAQRALEVVRARAQRLATHDTCGFALGLMATHAEQALSGVAP